MRIKAFPEGAVASDDYLVIDGDTNGTRKLPATPEALGAPEEAESDGKKYGRQNGEWVEIIEKTSYDEMSDLPEIEGETLSGEMSLDDISACRKPKRIALNITSLPYTYSDSYITAETMLTDIVLGTPSAQKSEWTWTTAAGVLTISGTLDGTTTLTGLLINAEV